MEVAFQSTGMAWKEKHNKKMNNHRMTSCSGFCYTSTSPIHLLNSSDKSTGFYVLFSSFFFLIWTKINGCPNRKTDFH